MVWIIIEDGEVFEGDLDMFSECFFADANLEQVQAFCDLHGWSVVIEER